ncbi:FAD-dependent monooxygenase [Methyloversatilis sp. XJ19-49]|uniref:FAD-dependent monooxygenase n=1 Tax=Methyloversatilis sp. XJ19-49 TaxID=2963429 RepID=UPI00211BBDD3|nr:FAD-dependent monooxygenase [Methyloversatilis sp. XJ19-49]MCQ9379765.1 FAD-dependent monooxygenase [Methyloversatilis sp. XJ19-49]
MTDAATASVRDAVIVGAGPIGLAAGCALRAAGLDVTVLDAGPGGRALDDTRVIALSAGSRDILRGLQAWPDADTTPIRRIHISQRGHLGRTELRAEDFRLEALGHVARAGTLVRALRERAGQIGLTVQHGSAVLGAHEGDETVHVRTAGGDLMAHALLWCEGRITDDEALSQQRDYDQHAVIALVTPTRPHDHVAYERFTPQGPVALLPCGRDYALVYTCASGDAQTLITESDAAFAARVSDALGGRVEVTAVGPRSAWPLTLRMRRDIVSGRQVWLGNAAQTLHPVAGQGLNLGLRDVAQLSACLLPALARHSDDPAVALQAYARLRRADRIATGRFTDGLVRIFGFGSTHPGLGALAGHARGAALALLDACPPARQFIGRRMMFGARGW